MKCNHDRCASEFCPHCGEHLRPTPIHELRLYLTQQIASRAAAMVKDDVRIKRCAGDNAESYWVDAKRRHMEAKAKWERWLAAFCDLIERAQ